MTTEEYRKAYTQRLNKLQLNDDILQAINMLNIAVECMAHGNIDHLKMIIGYVTYFRLSKGMFGVHVSNEEAYLDFMELLMDCYLSRHDDITQEQFLQIVKEQQRATRDYINKLLEENK